MECMPGDHIKFDFLGKDSIRYENEVVVHPKVYALIKKFCHHSANNKRKAPCICTAICLFIFASLLTDRVHNAIYKSVCDVHAVYLLCYVPLPSCSVYCSLVGSSNLMLTTSNGRCLDVVRAYFMSP